MIEFSIIETLIRLVLELDLSLAIRLILVLAFGQLGDVHVGEVAEGL